MTDDFGDERTKRVTRGEKVREWDGGRLYYEGTRRAVTFLAPADVFGRVTAYGVDVDAHGVAWAVAVPAKAVMELVMALEAGFTTGEGDDGGGGEVDEDEVRWRHVVIHGGGQVGGGGKPGGGSPGGTEPLPPEVLSKKARAIFAVLEIPASAAVR